MLCLECQTYIDSDLNTCPECGLPLGKLTPKKLYELQYNPKYCIWCGKKFGLFEDKKIIGDLYLEKKSTRYFCKNCKDTVKGADVTGRIIELIGDGLTKRSIYYRLVNSLDTRRIFVKECIADIIDEYWPQRNNYRETKLKNQAKESFNLKLLSYGFHKNGVTYNDYIIWDYNDSFYFTKLALTYEITRVKEDITDINVTNEIGHLAFTDIIYFKVEGNVQYVTRTEGGGGGGTDLAGAIVGGLIAGSTGAIVGGRRKIDPISTTTTAIDDRIVILCHNKGDQVISTRLKSINFLDFFRNTIPEKEYDLLNLTSQNPSEPTDPIPVIEQTTSLQTSSNTTSISSIKERLHNLEELYNAELITDDEYKTKRQEILSQL